MILQTLPRFAPHVACGLARVAAAGCLAPTAHLRGRAALQAVEALRTGRLRPATVQRALAAGDAGMARLFMRRHRLPPRARIARGAIALQGHDRRLSPNVRDGLADLIRVFAADGDLSLQDCRDIAGNDGCNSLLLRRLASAWARRCDRVSAPVRACLPTDSSGRGAFFVMPMALLVALGSDYYARIYDEAEVDGRPLACVGVNSDRDVVTSRWNHVGDRVAVRAAWNAVLGTLQAPLMESADAGLSTLIGYPEELLRDMALTCRWDGDQPRIDDAMIEELGEEIGLDATQARDREGVVDYLRFVRENDRAQHWTIRHADFQAWRRERLDTPAATVVERLLALHDLARAFRKRSTPAVTWDFSEEGLMPVCLRPVGIGIDGYVDQVLQDTWGHQSDGEAVAYCDAGGPAAMGRALDRIVFDAALASAAARIVEHTTDGEG